MQVRTAANRISPQNRWLARGAAALLAIAAFAAMPTRAHAGVYVSVDIAPPALPVYVQPAIPGAGYIWTPGYWAWGGGGYYWVPGTWVLAPFTGALWTPGYWGWSGGAYLFHPGYWGWHVGFYGGINYGFGYTGYGYAGGYWGGNRFYYNRTVNHVTNNITNVYNRTVVNNTTIINRTSYNGGAGGIAARATPQQQAWARERQSGPVAAQLQQRSMASRMPAMRASVNHGAPAISATPRVGAFEGRGIAAARGAAPVAMAAREARYTPHAAAAYTQPHFGNLRSASFAPHAATAMRPDTASRYGNPATANRDVARPGAYEPSANRAPNRYQPADNGYRGAPYRPQANQAQAYRPAAHYAQPEYRQSPQSGYRPAQHYAQPEYRQAPHYAQPAPRQAYARPAQYAHAAAPRGRAAPAPHEERRDDRRH